MGGPSALLGTPSGTAVRLQAFPLVPDARFLVLGSFGEVFCLFSFFIQMGSGGLFSDCLCVARCLNFLSFLSLSFFAAFSTFLT